MRRITFLFVIGALLAAPAFAQTTTVTGTVTDPNGFPYYPASIKAQLTTPGATVTVNNQQQCASGGFGSAPCQVPIQGTFGPTPLSSTGAFTMVLYDNTQIQPASTQWQFTVSISPGIPPPLGTGPQTFTVAVTISGASQTISASLNAVAPKLSGAALGGGGGSTPSGIATGPAQAQLVTTNVNWPGGATQPCAGCQISVQASTPNTAVDPTLAINGGSPITIKNTGQVQIAVGDFNQNCGYQLMTFDGTFLIEQEPCTQTAGGYPTTGGPANLQTLTITPPITALPPGVPFAMQAGVSNTGPMTLNISGTGGVAVTKCGTVPLASGDWLVGSSEVVQFDRTELQLLTPPAAVPCGSPAVTQTLCSGTVVLGTSAIGSAAKGNSATSTCTGLATTDVIVVTSNAEVFGITGFAPSASGILTINCWPTTNTVNCEEENNTGGSITPAAVTVNYRVVR